DKDAKALAMIYVGKNQVPVLLGTNNNDKMFAFELMKNEAGKVAYNQTDHYVDVFLKDGRKIRNEVSTGNGYMSQNARIIAFIPSLTDKVIVTDEKNQQRTVYQSAALASK